MKLLIYTDNHFSETSSIITGMGENFSLRLENQIKSIEWTEKLAKENEVDKIICLGDFFDKPKLNANELTAFSSIKWDKDNPQRDILVGNHDATNIELTSSATALFDIANTYTNDSLNGWDNLFNVINQPIYEYLDDGTTILWLPYIVENKRKSLKEYIGDEKIPDIILSHNDIKGLQMGQFLSQEGFDIKDIEENCKLFVNGHLHNGMKFCENGINLGNLTGQNFSEDAFTYNHSAMLLDTKTLKYELIENPYAFNFYKFEINTKRDLKKFDKLKNNAVLSIKCASKYKEELLDIINTKNIISYRISYIVDMSKVVETKVEFTGDVFEEHKKFCESSIEGIDLNLLNNELDRIYYK